MIYRVFLICYPEKILERAIIGPNLQDFLLVILGHIKKVI